jgi:microsomal prostaglandin-E synthase 2
MLWWTCHTCGRRDNCAGLRGRTPAKSTREQRADPIDASTQHHHLKTTNSTPAASLRPLPTLAWAAAGAGLAGVTLPAATPAAAEAPAPPVPSATTVEEDVYAPPSPPPPGLPSSVTLYQYEVCPFCCKVKAALDYYRVPYTVVEVSPLTKRQLKWGPHKKVPVAVLEPGGLVVADSSAIISRLAAGARAAGGEGGGGGSGNSSGRGWFGRRGGSASASAANPTTATPAGEPPALTPADAETAWRRWVDGRLVRVLTLNIYRTPGEAWQAFDYITEAGNFGGPLETGAARVVGAGMMWAIAGRLAKKYGILEAPRDALASVGREWVDGALGGGARPFAGGGAGPDLADLSAFGVWRAVAGTDTFGAAMAGNRELAAWYARMEGAVGPSARVAAVEGAAA